MAVEARSVTKTFGGDADEVTALDDVDVSIRENEFFTLPGPSGCGKTDAAAPDRGVRASDPRRDPPPRRGHLPPAALPAPGQHRVPELCALSPHERGGEHRLRSRDAPTAGRGGGPHRRRDARARAHGGVLGAKPRPDFRRPAAAGRARPGAGRAPARPAARRAAVGARSQASQGDADRAEAPPARDRDHLRVRDPRPGRGADHVRPHRGHERGPHPAGRRSARHLRPPRRALRRQLHRREQPAAR